MTTDSYVVTEVEDVGDVACVCGGCDWIGTADLVANIGDCALTPGDASPVGRCPECDSLCYIKHRVRGDSKEALLLVTEAEVLRELLLDSEAHAGEEAVPEIAYKAHEVIGRLTGLIERLLDEGAI